MRPPFREDTNLQRAGRKRLSCLPRRSGAPDLRAGCSFQRIGILFDRLSLEIVGRAKVRRRDQGELFERWRFEFERGRQRLLFHFFGRQRREVECGIGELFVCAFAEFYAGVFFRIRQRLADSALRAFLPRRGHHRSRLAGFRQANGYRLPRIGDLLAASRFQLAFLHRSHLALDGIRGCRAGLAAARLCRRFLCC